MNKELHFISFILFFTSIVFSSDKLIRTDINHSTGFENSWEKVHGLKYFTQDQIENKILFDHLLINGSFVLVEEIIELQGNLSKYNYTYDELANNIETLYYEFNAGKNEWDLKKRDTKTFDEKGNNISLLVEDFDNGEFVNNSKEENTFDDNGSLIESVNYSWDNDNKEWSKYYRFTRTYNSNGSLIEVLGASNNDGVWTIDYAVNNTYDDSGFLILTNYKQDFLGSGLVDLQKDEFINDQNGLMLEYVSSFYGGGMWLKSFHGYLTYDENNNHIGTMGYIPDGDDWVERTRITINYDENQNRSLYTYEVNDNDGNGWSLFRKIEYKYADLTTSVESEKVELPSKFELTQNYPNPFNPTTSIEYSLPSSEYVSLKVYDILGNQVATLVNEQKPAGNYVARFNASNLASGLYFYKIQAGSFSKVRKMMLIK